MRGNKCIENRIVEQADASFVIREIMSGWLVVVVEHKASAASYDPLWRLCYRHTLYLVQGTVKRLHRRERPDIPNPESTGNIR